jgi:HSP20 family protein
MAGESSLPSAARCSPAGEEDVWQTESASSWSWSVRRRPHLWRPPTDVYETDEAFVVLVEVAGMREAAFSVSLDKQLLMIRGMRADSPGAKAYHHMEIAYGDFATEVKLAVAIEASSIQAAYSDGFLRVVLPKAQPKRIPITD